MEKSRFSTSFSTRDTGKTARNHAVKPIFFHFSTTCGKIRIVDVEKALVFMDKFLIYNIYMDRTQRCILTNICLVYDGERILVVDRKKKDWPGLTFPGGHVEKDEDFNASVIREVKEETGLTIRNPILCGIEEFKTEKEDRYIMLYYKTDKFKGKLKKSDEGDVFWINRDELDSYKLSLDLKRILKVMESDNLSEIIYYRKEDKWLSKIV